MTKRLQRLNPESLRILKNHTYIQLFSVKWKTFSKEHEGGFPASLPCSAATFRPEQEAADKPSAADDHQT